ncbi:putative Transcription factor IIIB 90 kDa subunit [Hypsibius exemplaris]|uniref:General transcription factor TFIIB n=1 Tax=Hypsibius exemplaris TaxID=2072580 RepID=A0A1W0WDN4_HYPEX|nr:putative Transcription factor IIIB 90 kDa subunit [Hypsibius exemplaris]
MASGSSSPLVPRAKVEEGIEPVSSLPFFNRADSAAETACQRHDSTNSGEYSDSTIYCGSCRSDSIIYCGSCRSEATVTTTVVGTVCNFCGLVFEQEPLVNEILFEEGADGGTHCVGQQINLHNRGGTIVRDADGFGINSTSADRTLHRNARALQEKAEKLHAGQPDIVDYAISVYKRAFENNFTAGRKTILSACLFISCRKHGTSHSEQHFLPTAGGTLSEFRRTVRFLITRLNIHVNPAQDASFLVERFSQELLSQRMEPHRVTHIRILAEKIVRRMKKDWIDQGRRAGGIAAAAVVIACRIHGFEVDANKIGLVANISPLTIRKRMLEFSRTESAKLKPCEFAGTRLPPELCHPSYYEHLGLEQRVVLKDSDRETVLTQLRNVVHIATLSEDPSSGVVLSAEDKEDVKLMLQTLLRLAETLEEAADPPLHKSPFRATNLVASQEGVVGVEDASGSDESFPVMTDLMDSLLCNEAEQTVRRDIFHTRYGAHLAAREEQKKARDTEAAEKLARPAKTARRQQRYSSVAVAARRMTVTPDSEPPSTASRSGIVNVERFAAFLEQDARADAQDRETTNADCQEMGGANG